MDLQTMGDKLDKDKYKSMEQFASDMNLIFANCRQFNPPTTLPTLHADVLEKTFRKDWAKLQERRFTPEEKKAVGFALNKVKQEDP